MVQLIFIFLLLVGCSPSSPKDFRAEGKAKCRELVAILEKVDTREDLLKVEPQLKKKFDEIVNLLLLVKKYLEKHPEAVGMAPNPYSQDLLYELKRIYQITGGRETLERIQNEPAIRLSRSGLQKEPFSP